MDHVEDYIVMTGYGLGKVSDQVVEATHSDLFKRLMSSRYWIKDLESDLIGEMIFHGIILFNSYNVLFSVL